MESKQQVQVAENVLHCQNNSQDLYMIQERRSANYKPNIWKYDFLQSLSSKHDEEQYRGATAKLREEVQKIFGEALDLLATMKLVDSIVKLGLESYFEDIEFTEEERTDERILRTEQCSFLNIS